MKVLSEISLVLGFLTISLNFVSSFHKFPNEFSVRLRSHIDMGPIDSFKKLFSSKQLSSSSSFDYIIVGGGTAGCVLANRLSANNKKNVLVVEAGSSDFKNSAIRIPGGILRLFKSKFDWDFDSRPCKRVRNRPIYLARGKVLGGSSCINALLYHRGNANDYDSWAAVTGYDEWSAKNVLPYFKKSENFEKGANEHHGGSGEFYVSEVRYQNVLTDTYLKACEEQKFSRNDDFNDWSTSQEGYGPYHLMTKNGERCSAASAFLEPIIKSRKNLKIVTKTNANKILFKGNNAVGVEATDHDGKLQTFTLRPGGEVLLSGGAINSPQVLMLSGVGPKRHLKELGIEPIVDLPGVGQNLQDQPAVALSYEVSKGNEGISVTSQIRNRFIPGFPSFRSLAQWAFRRTGPLTSTGCNHGGFFKTSPQEISPDLQLRFLPARAVTPDGMTSFTTFRKTRSHPDGFSFQSILARPRSVGEVSLASADPKDKPVISLNYLDDERDLRTLREGIRLSRKIAKAAAFDRYRGQEVFPGEKTQSDGALNDYIRQTIHTSNALVGTCKLGSDPEAVVNADLRVKGLKGVRVVDASVIPVIPGGQTGAPVMMIAEKAADMILNRA